MQLLSTSTFCSLFDSKHPASVVYLLLSPKTGQFYVGSTKSFVTRMYQHFYGTTLQTRKKQVVHRFMAQFGIQHFCCLPLCIGHPALLLQLESKLIGLLNPPLNRDLACEHQKYCFQKYSSTSAPSNILWKKKSRPLMKFRTPNPNPSPILPTIYFGPKAPEGSVSLACVLLQHQSMTCFKISCYIGTLHVDDKKTLSRVFGSTQVTIPSLPSLPPQSLTSILPHLWQSTGHHHLLIHRVSYKTQVNDTYTVLLDLLRYPGTIRGLYTLSLNSIFRLYQAAQLWKAPKARQRLLTIINRVFRKRTNVSLTYRPVVTLPFGCEHMKKAVCLALHRIIDSWAVPHEVKTFFLKNSRIVIKKGSSIGSMVLNYRRVCKSTSFPFILNGARIRSVQGVRGNDTSVPPIIQQTLNQHVDFIPSCVAMTSHVYCSKICQSLQDLSWRTPFLR